MPSLTVVDLLGLAAGTLTTVAFVPQVWRVWRTRSAADISLAMYVVFTCGTSTWLAYGLALHALPVIVANVITTGLAGCVLLMKLRFEREKAEKNC
ncbi:MAG TPA: SemiSWEET transporter [Nevskiaceae bacterium]|nr:SemiSWEET transporter [Nevskiaceae bacterium]